MDINVVDEDVETQSLFFDMLDNSDLQLGDALERIILANQRLKKHSKGKDDVVSRVEAFATRIESYVNQKTGAHNL